VPVDLAALIPFGVAGDNVLAGHWRNTAGGQYIDVGIELGAEEE
jgi:hypothetical protein